MNYKIDAMGDILRRIRTTNNWTNRELIRDINADGHVISEAHYWNILKGKRCNHLKIGKRVQERFGINLFY
jgi:hypothetical protein